VTPKWISQRALLLLHEESLARFGGSRGMRDMGLLESALARPQNKLVYEPESSLFRLAAAYCFGIAKNHPFVDGNKRAAFLAGTLFMALNGQRLEVHPMVAADAVLSVVEGAMDEEGLSDWFERFCVGGTGEPG